MLKTCELWCVCAGELDCIASGCFTSVVVHQDQVYAADSNAKQTQVFQHISASEPRWRLLRSVFTDIDKTGRPLRLSISKNQLKFCSTEDTIKVYSLSGELLQTYVIRGCDDADQLYHPVISDTDDDGSVLITPVMSEQGEFSVLQLQPPVSRPSCAVLFNNQLYVTSLPWSGKNSIYKYSC